jgi:DNA-binding transcriptional regulator YiaG
MNEEFERIERIKRLYQVICNGELGDDPGSLQRRVDIIRYLEGELKTEFRDTQDFHEKIRAFLMYGGKKRATEGRRLKEAREKLGWSQQKLAEALGVSRQTIIRFENNKYRLSRKALKWLKNHEQNEVLQGKCNKTHATY